MKKSTVPKRSKDVRRRAMLPEPESHAAESQEQQVEVPAASSPRETVIEEMTAPELSSIDAIIGGIQALELDASSSTTTAHDNSKINHIVYFSIETTGSQKNSEICQIAAVHGSDSFSVYVMPHNGISDIITRFNGFSVRAGQLYSFSYKVDTVPLKEAWVKFIDFIETKGTNKVLAAYKLDFAARFLLRDIQAHNLMKQFKSRVTGFAGISQILTSIYSGPSKKLTDIIVNQLGDDFNFQGPRNANYKVRGLQQLMTIFNLEKSLTNVVSVDDASQRWLFKAGSKQ